MQKQNWCLGIKNAAFWVYFDVDAYDGFEFCINAGTDEFFTGGGRGFIYSIEELTVDNMSCAFSEAFDHDGDIREAVWDLCDKSEVKREDFTDQNEYISALRAEIEPKLREIMQPIFYYGEINNSEVMLSDDYNVPELFFQSVVDCIW